MLIIVLILPFGKRETSQLKPTMPAERASTLLPRLYAARRRRESEMGQRVEMPCFGRVLSYICISMRVLVTGRGSYDLNLGSQA